MRVHVRRRARERYGLRLVRDDLDAIVGQILRREKAWRVRDESNRKAHFLVHYADTYLPVVYDRSRQELATVLPWQVAEEYREELGV